MICFQDRFLLEVVLRAQSWEVLSALNFHWRQQGLWHLAWAPLTSLSALPAVSVTSGHLQELPCALPPASLPLRVGALCLWLQTLLYPNCWVLQTLFIRGSSKCCLLVAPIKIQRFYHLWHFSAVAGLAKVSHRKLLHMPSICPSGGMKWTFHTACTGC